MDIYLSTITSGCLRLSEGFRRRSVEHRGLEPLTYCLQSSRATNCANAPWTFIV